MNKIAILLIAFFVSISAFAQENLKEIKNLLKERRVKSLVLILLWIARERSKIEKHNENKQTRNNPKTMKSLALTQRLTTLGFLLHNQFLKNAGMFLCLKSKEQTSGVKVLRF